MVEVEGETAFPQVGEEKLRHLDTSMILEAFCHGRGQLMQVSVVRSSRWTCKGGVAVAGLFRRPTSKA